MKFLIDENVSRHISERLAQDGHTIVRVQDVALGQPDADVLALAQSLGAIVVTEDTDFGDLVMRLHQPAGGVVLLRLAGIPRAAQPDYVAHAIAAHALELPNSFTVVTSSIVRVRPLT